MAKKTPPAHNTATKTSTSAVNSTKLLVATAAFVAASGLAFMAGGGSYEVYESNFQPRKPLEKPAEPEERPPKGMSPVSCSDTDGGETPSTQGTATVKNRNSGRTVSFTDVCIDQNNVLEGVCVRKNKIDKKTIACGANEVCRTGACVSIFSCEDGDGGADLYVRATTTERGILTGAAIEHGDDCISTTTNKIVQVSDAVLEGICTNDGRLATATVLCPTTEACLAGKCINRFICRDSDNGSNPTNVKGNINVYDLLSTNNFPTQDTCKNAITVTEYSCLNDRAEPVEVACDPGQVCQDGACVASTRCTDTDPTNDPNVKGELTHIFVIGAPNPHVYTDTCMTTTTGNAAVYQGTCNGDQPATTTTRCAANETCQAGVCETPVDFAFSNAVQPSYDGVTLKFTWGNIGGLPARFIAGEAVYGVGAIDNNSRIVKSFLTSQAGDDGSGGVTYSPGHMVNASLNYPLPAGAATLEIQLNPHTLNYEENYRNNRYTLTIPPGLVP